MWSAIVALDRYRTWWPWLVRFEADGFDEGARWACTVQPPLPYTLRFAVTLERVVPCELVAAAVDGDIVGSARLTLDGGDGGGTTVRLESRLAPSNPLLRGIARVAAPVVRFGHDWVLDTGAAQFRRRAL